MSEFTRQGKPVGYYAQVVINQQRSKLDAAVVAADNFAQWMLDADAWRTEATALLERLVFGRGNDPTVCDAIAFLSRAPAQPAAPEPSAEYHRGYKAGSDDTASELLGYQERDSKLADAVNKATEHLDWRERLLSAEAQLAAVRAIAQEWSNADSRTVQRYGDAILGALTPDPSPGAGEKT